MVEMVFTIYRIRFHRHAILNINAFIENQLDFLEDVATTRRIARVKLHFPIISIPSTTFYLPLPNHVILMEC